MMARGETTRDSAHCDRNSTTARASSVPRIDSRPHAFTSGDLPAEALRELATPVRRGLRLLHRGDAGDGAPGERLAAGLAELEGVVVADCGTVAADGPAWAIAAGAQHSLLVLRSCYLAVRRA